VRVIRCSLSRNESASLFSSFLLFSSRTLLLAVHQSRLARKCLRAIYSFTLKILPVFDCTCECLILYKRRFSKERESVYAIWNVPAGQHVYYFDETLEGTSSFEPDKRSVVLLLHTDWPLMTFTSADVESRYPGITVTLSAEGREFSERKERERKEVVPVLLNVQILYPLRYRRLNKLFVLTILVHPPVEHSSEPGIK